MGEVNWTAYGTATTVLSTDLNSDTDGTESALSTEIDNTTNRDMFIDVEVFLSTFTPVADGFITIKVYSTVDGTNYDTAGCGQPEYSKDVAAGSSVTRYITFRGIPIGPGKYKLTHTNNTGASLAASANTVKYRAYSPTVA